MKKYVLGFLAIFSPFYAIFAQGAGQAIEKHEHMITATKADQAGQVAYKNTKKEKIVIISCIGGGGHTAVSKALYASLKKLYKIKVVNFYQDIASSFDTIGYCTFGKFRAEDLYNFCLQCRWVPIINRYLDIGCWAHRYRRGCLERSIEQFVRTEKPDLLISVIPIVNSMILNVAQKLQVPLLVITNDLDTTNYVHAVYRPNYKKFYYTLPFDDPAVRSKIIHARLPKEAVKIIGFPTRPEFFKLKNKEALKKKLGLPLDKPIVMILMGGMGSLVTVRYIKTLARVPMPLHIVACLGKNEKIRRHIKRVILPENISLTILGFTDNIADLMAVSDVLITKPGPNSMCEAIASRLPIIMDKTGSTLWWEQINIDFVKKHKIGDVLESFGDLEKILTKYVKNINYTNFIKNNMTAINNNNFDQNLKKLIAEILGHEN